MASCLTLLTMGTGAGDGYRSAETVLSRCLRRPALRFLEGASALLPGHPLPQA